MHRVSLGLYAIFIFCELIIYEDYLETDNVGGAGTGQFVNQTDTGNHVSRFDGVTNDA